MILFRDGKQIDCSKQIGRSFSVGALESLNLAIVALEGGEATLEVEITGEGAAVNVSALFLGSGDDRIRIKVNLTHSCGGSKSNQLFKGIAAGQSRVSFDGKIVVAPDAQKTEAFQTSCNLQLSDNATVETSPQLEIYADDVKCSHGATVGSLDEDEQFYMRSRGISLAQARRLQMISFLSPVMADLDEKTREAVEAKLQSFDVL